MSRWNLCRGYVLELTMGYIGTAPARVSGSEEVLVTTDLEFLEKEVRPLLSHCKSRVAEVHVVVLEENTAYIVPAQDPRRLWEAIAPVKVVTPEVLKELMGESESPFQWAPDPLGLKK